MILAMADLYHLLGVVSPAAVRSTFYGMTTYMLLQYRRHNMPNNSAQLTDRAADAQGTCLSASGTCLFTVTKHKALSQSHAYILSRSVIPHTVLQLLPATGA